MQKHIIHILLLACLFTAVAHAQQEIAIGEWKLHFPFNRGKWVTQSDEKVYYASDQAIFTLDKEDLSVEFFTRTDGLSDVGVRRLEYDRTTNTLVVGYENSNIDLIAGDGVFNLANIKDNNQIIGERHINQIDFDGQGFAYLSTAFGLVQINLSSRTFGFTAFTDMEVFDMTVWNGRFYISTEEGIFSAPGDASFNHSDFSSWELMEEVPGLPQIYGSNALAVYGGSLYAGIDGDLYRIGTDSASVVLDEEDHDLFYLHPGYYNLIAGFDCATADCVHDKTWFMRESGEFVENGDDCVFFAQNAIEAESGFVFYGELAEGVRYSGTAGGPCVTLFFDGPLGQTASDFEIVDNVVYAASGNVTNDLNYTFNPDGLQIYENGDWSFINRDNREVFQDPVMLDFYQVEVHPATGTIYVGTFWGGLVQIKTDGSINIYNEENSCIEKYPEEGLRERVAGMAFDRQNALWLTANRAPEPIVRFDEEGNCRSFRAGGVRDLTDLTIDHNGYKWAAVFSNEAGLVVFDEGDLEDPADDRLEIISTANSELATNRVLCVTTDLDGDVWVGTDEGTVVFECTGAIFDQGCSGTRRKVDEGGNIAFLLEDEIVQTIAVDGANRKWFGTRGAGIFVQSPSGEDKVAQFNTGNSPLPSNDIKEISINEETGEVWIATVDGIASFRTDATHGGEVHDSEVYAFPNPVRPDYDGPIAIRGLPRDANVKITDIRGRLIYETTANGGEAIWDGRDYNGRQASTGVYLVYSASDESFEKPDALVTKILFVK